MPLKVPGGHDAFFGPSPASACVIRAGAAGEGMAVRLVSASARASCFACWPIRTALRTAPDRRGGPIARAECTVVSAVAVLRRSTPSCRGPDGLPITKTMEKLLVVAVMLMLMSGFDGNDSDDNDGGGGGDGDAVPPMMARAADGSPVAADSSTASQQTLARAHTRVVSAHTRSHSRTTDTKGPERRRGRGPGRRPTDLRDLHAVGGTAPARADGEPPGARSAPQSRARRKATGAAARGRSALRHHGQHVGRFAAIAADVGTGRAGGRATDASRRPRSTERSHSPPCSRRCRTVLWWRTRRRALWPVRRAKWFFRTIRSARCAPPSAVRAFGGAAASQL